MKLGGDLITYLRAGIPVPEAISRMRYHGITLLDFPGFRTYMPQARPVHEQLRWARQMERLGMEMYSAIYLPENNMGSRDPEERAAAIEEAKPTAEFVHNLGGKAVCFCEAAGRANYEQDLSKDEAMVIAAESCRRYCEWADEKYGLKVILEIAPYGGNLCTIEAMKHFCDLVGAPNLYINADVGHLNMQKVNGKRFSKAGDRIISVHISDDDNRGDEGKVVEQDCLLGDGTTRFEDYMAELKAYDVDAKARAAGLEEAPVIIECFDYNHGVPDPDWVMIRCLDYIYKHIPQYFQNSLSFLDD